MDVDLKRSPATEEESLLRRVRDFLEERWA